MSPDRNSQALATDAARSVGDSLPLSSAPERRPRWPIMAAVVVLALLAVGFSTTFQSLWRAWRENPNYSHGILIPPISLFLVWRLRKQIATTPVASSWLGLLVLIAGVLLQIIGLRGDVTIFQGWAFLLVVAGMVWTWFGFAMLRRLWFPIAFLAFMVPALPFLMNSVSFRLKVLAADGAVHLASLFGAPVVKQGMNLFFPTGTLTVENACSGLNSLIALMALGALFGHLSTSAPWKGWLLFAASVPIAIGANVIRITSLATMASLTDAETASGVFHDIGGFLLFGVALLFLFGFRKALRC